MSGVDAYYRQQDPRFHSMYRQYSGLNPSSGQGSHYHYHYDTNYGGSQFGNNQRALVNIRLRLEGQTDEESQLICIYSGISIQELNIIIRQTFGLPSNYFITGVVVPVAAILYNQRSQSQSLNNTQSFDRDHSESPVLSSHATLPTRSVLNRRRNRSRGRSTAQRRSGRNNNDRSDNDSNDDGSMISSIRSIGSNANNSNNGNNDDNGSIGNNGGNGRNGIPGTESNDMTNSRSRWLENPNATTIVPLSYLSVNANLFQNMDVILELKLNRPIPILGWQIWLSWARAHYQAIVVFVVLMLVLWYCVDMFDLYPWQVAFWMWTNFINPWSKHVYRYGPATQIAGIHFGFWQGKDLPDICSYWGSQSADFWARNMDECRKMYERNEYAFCSAVAIVFALVLIFKYVGKITRAVWDAVLDCFQLRGVDDGYDGFGGLEGHRRRRERY